MRRPALLKALALVALAAPALALAPYVLPIEAEGEAPPGLEVRVEEAWEADIYYSTGYREARVLGKKITVRGTALNHGARPLRGLRVVLRAEDLFGRTLASCEALLADLAPGEGAPFECALEVKAASDLHAVKYSAAAEGDDNPGGGRRP
ncbi:MAG: hypothetical protein Kow0025_09780 [Thermodesulfovibrionales bacterium]